MGCLSEKKIDGERYEGDSVVRAFKIFKISFMGNQSIVNVYGMVINCGRLNILRSKNVSKTFYV